MTTAIIGAGVMGETLLSGLVRAGRRVDQLLVGEKRPERARELEERYGVSVVGNAEAAAKADTVAIVPGSLYRTCAPDLASGRVWCVVVHPHGPVRRDGGTPNAVFQAGR